MYSSTSWNAFLNEVRSGNISGMMVSSTTVDGPGTGRLILKSLTLTVEASTLVVRSGESATRGTPARVSSGWHIV